jgi:hypothetical protein
VRADVGGQWVIEVDNGGLLGAAGVTLDLTVPIDGGTLPAPGQATSAPVPTNGAARWGLPLAAGDQLDVSVPLTPIVGCVDAALLRPDGSVATQARRCGGPLIGVTVTLELQQAVDVSGQWELLVFNGSTARPFTVSASI